MLSNFAQSHYFINRSTMAIWDEFIVSLKKFFENFEWKRMNMIRWQIINLNEIIAVNFILSTSECFTKLIIKIDLLQRKIESKMMKSFHLRKNIIRTIRGHSALLIELTISSDNVSSLVSNLHLSIVNYEAMHKPPQQRNYVQFYNDKMWGNEKKMKFFLLIVIIEVVNRIFAIEIVFMINIETHHFENFIERPPRVKNVVSCAKKSNVESSTIINKNGTNQEKNSRKNDFNDVINLNSIKFINNTSWSLKKTNKKN